MAVALAGGLGVQLLVPRRSSCPFAGLFADRVAGGGAPAARVAARAGGPVGRCRAANFFTATVEDTVFTMALAVGAWALGEAARNRRVAIEEEARRAVGEEQARIARELHDVIAHSVSVIVVQAAAADDVFDDAARPGARGAALDRARRARRARASCAGCSAPCGPDARATRPARSPASTASTSWPSRCAPAGSRWSCAARAPAAPLPAGVDLSAYRIVQEALTNTLRHARATRAEVTVALRRRRARGRRARRRARPRPEQRHGGGHGLVGMRERAALLGGTLEAGPAAGRRLPRARPPAAGAGAVSVRVRDRRRPGARARRLPHDPRRQGGHRGGGRGRRRRARRSSWSSALRPDVVLMDVRMPERGRHRGDAPDRRRRAARRAIIILTTYDLDEYVFAALRAGASGFLLKDVRPPELVEAIRVVAARRRAAGRRA